MEKPFAFVAFQGISGLSQTVYFIPPKELALDCPENSNKITKKHKPRVQKVHKNRKQMFK